MKIGVIGLGYVGLPLAIESSKYFHTIGFDINKKRVEELKLGIDKTNEVSKEELIASINGTIDSQLHVSDDPEDLRVCELYIVTVPTPINADKTPDISPLINASELVGKVLENSNIVVYESTVYPGLTEEICVPILEKISGLVFKEHFEVGYSPERINPGDKLHRLTNINKVVSASSIQALEVVANFYKTFIKAEIYRASSIKVAEASKVIENTQRDLNIAFVNELSNIFNLMEIDTNEVLEAASTKWNFLNFRPGLVGGHCIGIDPYYLAYKAQKVGYHPDFILSGRRINDGMVNRIIDDIFRLMISRKIDIINSRILVLGVTFKENCPDYRNSKSIEIIQKFRDLGLYVDAFDPHVNCDDFYEDFSFKLTENIILGSYDVIVLSVAHKEFLKLNYNLERKQNSVIYDVKGFLSKDLIDKSL